MKLVIPMAGRGSRFASAGIYSPKPLINVLGEPMLAWAMKSIKDIECSQIIFIILQEHNETHNLEAYLCTQYPKSKVIILDHVKEGQLATVLTAKPYIFDDEPVLIANCDTYIVSNLAQDIKSLSPDCKGMISVAYVLGDQWSFARVNEDGLVVEVAEKVRISEHASTGFYYFSSGKQLIEVAEQIIADGYKTRGEYYVIMVYEKYIEYGWKVILSRATEMWDMGTPRSLDIFTEHLLSSGNG